MNASAASHAPRAPVGSTLRASAQSAPAARRAENDQRDGRSGEHEVDIRRPNLERRDEDRRRRADRGELERDGPIGAHRVRVARAHQSTMA